MPRMYPKPGCMSSDWVPHPGKSKQHSNKAVADVCYSQHEDENVQLVQNFQRNERHLTLKQPITHKTDQDHATS